MPTICGTATGLVPHMWHRVCGTAAAGGENQKNKNQKFRFLCGTKILYVAPPRHKRVICGTAYVAPPKQKVKLCTYTSLDTDNTAKNIEIIDLLSLRAMNELCFLQ